MAHGVHVFGAASMGALRAAELSAFGMIGERKRVLYTFEYTDAWHELRLEVDDAE